jgi:hypothetical protein
MFSETKDTELGLEGIHKYRFISCALCRVEKKITFLVLLLEGQCEVSMPE